jgi:N-acetylmuramoyl-L-alanine amidase
MMKRILQVAVILGIFGSVSLAQVKGLAGWNIVLDPGHSQTENMGIYNYSEAEKNLRVVKALREMLLTTTDIDTVYLTRTNDQESVDLSQRTDYANSLGAAWFHSVHSDAGSPSANSTLLLWGQYRTGQEKVPNGGKKMSSYMVDLLTRGMRTNTAGSFGDCTFYGCTSTGPYLHVNRESAMASELSEAGFHTSPLQNQRNMNAEWKRLEAWTFYWSILKNFKLARPGVHILTGFVSDFENGELVNDATILADGKSYTTDGYASLFKKYSSDPNQLRNGFYYLENISSSPVYMTVEAPGYYADTLQVAMQDTFFTFKDLKLISKRPPFVQSSTPAQGSTKFPAWEGIAIQFSRPVDPTSVQQAFKLQPTAKGTFTWFDDNRSMIFKPDTLQYELDYTLTISADAVDRYGHHLDGNGDGTAGDAFVITFKTGPADLFPPRLSNSSPRPNALNVDLLPIINLIYSEPADPASVKPDMIKLFRSSDMTQISGLVRYYVAGERSVISFFPSQTLSQNQQYKVQVEAGLKDLLGNTEIAQKTFSFKTGTTVLQPLPIDRFESGLDNWLEPQQSGSTGGIITEKTGRVIDVEHVNLLSKSTKSMRLNYAWDSTATTWLIREYLNTGTPKNVRFDNTNVLQALVFGDASGTQFRFCVDDRVPNYAAENHEVSPWYTIDWLGWKWVQWDMSTDAAGSWLGDGRLDGSLGFDSIQLSYKTGGNLSGTIYIDDLQFAKKTSVLVERDPAEQIPATFELLQNYPNPFNGETVIKYKLAEPAATVRLEVFDVSGRLVCTLFNGEQGAGEHQLTWNGRDEQGHTVASGIYFYMINTGQEQAARAMILAK